MYSSYLHCFTLQNHFPASWCFIKYVFDSSVAKYIPTLGGTLQFCRMLIHCELVQLAS